MNIDIYKGRYIDSIEEISSIVMVYRWYIQYIKNVDDTLVVYHVFYIEK
nr:MAG TPA: hypothetical protein [Caudoviricetes sp.]